MIAGALKRNMFTTLAKTLSVVKGSYWLSSGLYSFLSKFAAVVFGFFNFFILIRMLTRESYGVWILFVSTTTLLELIKHGFIRNPLIRYLTISNINDSGSLQTASIFLSLIIGLLQVVVVICFAFFLSKFWAAAQLKSLFFIYILTTVAFIPAHHFETVQQAGMQFKEFFYGHLVKQGGLFLFIVSSYFFSLAISLNNLAIAHFASVILACGLSYFLSARLLIFGRLEKKWVSQLFHYGKYTFGTNISSMIVKNIDTWMLGRMISVEAVTIFNPAIRVSNLVEVPNDTLSTIYFPRLSKDVAQNGTTTIKYFYERAVGSILAIMIPAVLVIIVFADVIIRFIAGPGFDETVPILQVTMLYGLLVPFNRFFGVTLDAIGKADINFRIVLLTAVLNTVANIAFINYFGIIGAAYGTLMTYMIMVASNQVYLNRHFGITIGSIAVQAFRFYGNLLRRLTNSKTI